MAYATVMVSISLFVAMGGPAPASAEQPDSVFAGMLRQDQRNPSIEMNPRDLGNEWQRSSILRLATGSTVWLWTSQGEVEAKVRSVEITRPETDPSFWYAGTVMLRLEANRVVPNGIVLVFLSKPPVQRWKTESPTLDERRFALADVKRRFEQATGKRYAGKYSYQDPGLGRVVIDLDQSPITIIVGGSHRFMTMKVILPGYNESKFVILDRVGNEWKEHRVIDDDAFERQPWVDVDGDGMPELFHCGEGGYECELSSFYPGVTTVLAYHSGV